MNRETRRTSAVEPDFDSDEVHRLYDLLNILDSKASALLTFNAIGLAAIAVWLGYVPLNFLHLSLDVVFLLILVSCGLLLVIIFLRWADRGIDVDDLEKTRLRRTVYYHVAWAISLTCVVLVFVVAAVHSVGTALIAFDSCDQVCQRFYSDAVFGNLDYNG
ncbi:hypothetical protein [Microbacterium sp. SS28]|uniref:hypothetical protein n=1 Tax=Microbacterium sp. SS28 TaxID=2919948 RepID=UPI001FAA3883|nr:hypothetical protein [Microbacterium sp. SS28]